jgi:hypothetical protein
VQAVRAYTGTSSAGRSYTASAPPARQEAAGMRIFVYMSMYVYTYIYIDIDMGICLVYVCLHAYEYYVCICVHMYKRILPYIIH